MFIGQLALTDEYRFEKRNSRAGWRYRCWLGEIMPLTGGGIVCQVESEQEGGSFAAFLQNVGAHGHAQCLQNRADVLRLL